MKTVAVYGSSMVRPEESVYTESYNIGKALAEAGFAVMTGGYRGVMEAASRGASESGGHVIGVTTGTIETFRGGNTAVNRWVADEIRHPTLRERVLHLVLKADAYVCMPGGLGTLHELTSVWELMRVGDIPRRPLICYGNYWHDMLEKLHNSPYIRQDAWDMLEFVNTPDEVIRILKV